MLSGPTVFLQCYSLFRLTLCKINDNDDDDDDVLCSNVLTAISHSYGFYSAMLRRARL